MTEDRKLGLRPLEPDRFARAPLFSDHLVQVPEHPVVMPPPPLDWPMDHNNQAGCCVVAGGDHALQAVAASLGVPRQNWSDATQLAYYQTQNPDFRTWDDGDTWRDNGMVIQRFLDFLVKQREILAFGRIDVDRAEEIKAAAYLGLAVITGETLRRSQVGADKSWDWDPGSPSVGGHCTVWVGYDELYHTVTWGDLFTMTQAFVDNQVSEAWFVLTQAHIDRADFRANFNLASFSKAISDLTDGKVVVPVPDTPTPDPGAASFQVSPATAARVAAVAARRKVTPDAWLDQHLRSYFGIV